MIVIFTGLPGSGKSLKLARTIVDILYRNRGIYEKSVEDYEGGRLKAPVGKLVPDVPPRRVLYTNLKLSEEVEKEFEGFVQYWTDLDQLTPLRDCDVVIDEVATYFDARLWADLPQELRRWLAQHRKFGIEIYGTAQDFAQVDKSFRRLTSDLLYLTKLVGSRDISATRPDPKYIWGVSLVRTLDPTVYDELKSKFAGGGGIPRFMFITRRATEIFDTRAEIRFSKEVPLRHIDKRCNICGLRKAVHV